MIYIAIETKTGRANSFKGAYKLAEYVKTSVKTVYRATKKKEYHLSEKEYNGHRIAKAHENPIKYQQRGKMTMFNGKKC